MSGGVLGGLFDFVFGGPPEPDPLIGQSAAASAATGARALDWSMDVFNNYIKPRQQQLDAINLQAANQSLQDQRSASTFTDQARRDYSTIYKPMEARSAGDAANYDQPGNINRRMGLASANVNQGFTNARNQAISTLQRYGINPNSGAFAATLGRLAQQQALSEAGARTGAAFDTMDKAIALRAGVVQTGRGLTNSAAQSLAGATGAGSAAVGGSAQAAGVGVQGVNAAQQGFGTALQGYGQAGSIMNNQFGTQAGIYSNRLGQMTDLAGSAAGMGYGAYMMSSKSLKDRKQTLDSEPVLEKIKGLKVDRWGYKGDPMLHIGPYAEDMHAKFGVGNGEMLGAADAGGVALAGLKELNDKVDALGKHVGVKVNMRGAQ